jgi:hypothetical protein
MNCNVASVTLETLCSVEGALTGAVLLLLGLINVMTQQLLQLWA